MRAIVPYIFLSEVMERFVPQRPDLKENHPIAPHITASGVLAVVEGLTEDKDRERHMFSSTCLVVHV